MPPPVIAKKEAPVKPWNNCTARERTEENGPLQKTEYQFDSCSVVVYRDTNKFKLKEKNV